MTPPKRNCAQSIFVALLALALSAAAAAAAGSARSSDHYTFNQELFNGGGGLFQAGTHQIVASLDWLGRTSAQSASYVLVSGGGAWPFNSPPIANAGPGQVVEATSPGGAPVALNGNGSSDPDGDALTFTWSGPFGTTSGPTPVVLLPLGSNLVTLTLTDTAGATTTATVSIKVQDTTPPVLTMPDNAVVEASGPGGTIVTFSVEALDLVDGPVPANSSRASGSTFPLGTTAVICWAADSRGNCVTNAFTVTVVDSFPPTVTGLEAVPSPVATNTPVVLGALAGDPLAGGSRIAGAAYTFDGTNFLLMLPQDGTFDSFSELVVATLGPFSNAGVYTIQVRVWDEQNNVGESELLFLPVYDPSAGFVTGGGWINSPLGAFHPELVEFADVTGKANFGFVSKYQKGANVPSGNTEFQFKAGNLNFKSTAYQWLVVAGAKAQFKGRGTINGEGNYAFMLTAIDGQVSGGGGADRFRIKLWDEASGTKVYDNQHGADDTAGLTGDGTLVQGGSIVIHKGK